MLTNGTVRKGAVVVGTALFWLAVWHFIAVLVAQEVLIPSPWTVVCTIGALITKPLFWKSVGLTLLRVCFGFLAALVVGVVLAVLTTRFSLLHTLFSPLLHIVRAAPVASFIIITLVWIVYDAVPVFISFLMVLPIIWINVSEGIRQTDEQLLEMASLFRLSKRRQLFAVYIPSVKPYFLTAAVNGLSFAWKSAVAAEVICRPDFSIGRQLQEAKLYMETPQVFAWTAVVILLSLVLEHLLLCATANARRKKGGEGVD